eukprot:TRINITY_DN5329_c0_g1_i1.p1 TRINITY_DN5329_c0_g1~~TRINITY_DN5329_c0_g1_i1.p1  ORF type:complete len:833 (-),score=126.24 TRINITY_DN5329_c0_g1_i1:74-2572(-)
MSVNSHFHSKRSKKNQSHFVIICMKGGRVRLRSLSNFHSDTMSQPPKNYEELIKNLSDVINDEMKDKDIPSVAVAIVEGNEVKWAEGFGIANSETNAKATADTIYRIGSVSKLFTDIAVMQCVEKGELSLDADIVDYIPTFNPKNTYGKKITLRNLMSHTSGLPRESPVGNYTDSSEPSLEATVDALNKVELHISPNTDVKYSNAGIAVVGRTLEKLKSKPFVEHLEESVIQPLGMTNSTFKRPQGVPLSDGLMWGYDGRKFKAPTFELGEAPAGCMYSTVLDLAKFLIAIFNDGTSPITGKSILKKETLEEMLKPQHEVKDRKAPRMGLGFRIRETDDGAIMHQHGGAIYGFATFFRFIKDENVGVAVVANKDAMVAWANQFSEYVLQQVRSVRKNIPASLKWHKLIMPETEFCFKMEGDYLTKDNERLSVKFRKGCSLDLLGRTPDILTVEGTKVGGIKKVRMIDGTRRLVVDDVFNLTPDLTYVEYNDDFSKITVSGNEFHRCQSLLPIPQLPKSWEPLIGEYGFDHSIWYICEMFGKLYCLALFFDYSEITHIGGDEDPNLFTFPQNLWNLFSFEKLRFVWNSDNTQVEGFKVGESLFLPRRLKDVNSKIQFRIPLASKVEDLRPIALKATPPTVFMQEPKRDIELVELKSIDPTIQYDLRYATSNNFFGTPMYSSSHAFLQKPAAEALGRVHKALEKEGYGLLIHDPYRPWYVTKIFWMGVPDSMKIFVADPDKGSQHNRGCAVDLTLVDLKTGQPVDVGAGYDEPTDRSFADYPGGTSQHRHLRRVLRSAMEKEGFVVYVFEWWHFDYKDAPHYPICNKTFEELLN